MIESYDINDYLKDDKELQKAVIRELFKEITTQQGKLDAYKISENEANEIIAELKAENDRMKAENENLNKMTGIFSARLCEKYRTTLQEIKTIAEENKDTAQYDGVCRSILTIITKAEEE